MNLAAGTCLGSYKILGRLGAGGMGEVYRARDSKLDRQVAVKVLAERLVQDPEALERFAREAKAVAALSHPNILAIYDFGREGDVCYTVMELLEGHTLRTCLQPGPLPPRVAVGYALQIAQGLAAAHDKGIVHRDLKPENVFVNQDGHVKILDFGLVRHTRPPASRSASSFPTDPGRIMGTAGYMSPEQVRGLPADPRSDVFCFGLLLYEMLWGEHAFNRPTSAETMTAILREEIPRLAEETACPFPASLGRLLRRCLEKSPRERFQSARDLAAALPEIEDDFQGHAARETPEVPSIAVLPFRNLSSSRETEYFSDGMTEEILNALARIDDLRVAARSSSFAFKGKDEDVRKIGQQLNVRSVLEGSVRQAGDRIRVIVQLVDVAGGYQLWSERYDRQIGDVFAMQDEIACAIAETLKVRLLRMADEPLVRVGTRDLEAYDRYLKGLYSFHQRVLGPAIEQFRTAVAKDPGLIAAHTGLAHAYCLAGFYGGIPTLKAYAAAQEAAMHAQSLEPGFAEVHLVLGLIEHFFGWNVERGERELRRAIELRPRFSDAHAYLAQMLGLSGRFEEGIEAGQRAVELDPYSPLAHVMYSYSLIWARRFDEAIRAGEEAVRLRPDAVFPYLSLTMAHMSSGRYESAVAVGEKAVELTQRSHGYTNAQLGAAYAFAGRIREARLMLEELRERSLHEYVPPYCFARIYAALDDRDAAFAAFEAAIAERNTLLWALEHYDEFAHLRPDPRFWKLVEKVRAMAAQPD